MYLTNTKHPPNFNPHNHPVLPNATLKSILHTNNNPFHIPKCFLWPTRFYLEAKTTQDLRIYSRRVCWSNNENGPYKSASRAWKGSENGRPRNASGSMTVASRVDPALEERSRIFPVGLGARARLAATLLRWRTLKKKNGKNGEACRLHGRA